MTINHKSERGATDMTDMKFENIANDIQEVIVEQIELELYELKGNGEPQFLVKAIDGEPVAEGDIVLADLKKTFSYMSSRSYVPIDTSNYHGLLEVFYCKKKKGMFGKETLKTISSVRKPFHKDALEEGKEVKVSLKEMMKKK